VKTFVDTNILVYAYDRAGGEKRDVARASLEELWVSGDGVISTQVLQEFYVNVRRKARKPMSRTSVRSLIADYLAWNPVVIDGTSVLEAIDAERNYRLSFWDALIVVAAQASGAGIILSEDFNHGQKYGSVQVVNPFSRDPAAAADPG
jgi:predicted nucleic acid-binding protein